MRTLCAATFAVGLITGTAVSGQTLPRKSPELAFSLPDQGQRLLSQYRGKVVALEFILTTCAHCQAASKVMTRMQERYGSRGFQALDVAINPNADLLVQNFAKDFQVGFPVGWAPIEQMMAYMGFTERPVVPQLTMIDRNGMIHYQTPREGDANSLKEEVISERIAELLGLRSSASIAKGRTPR
ncbi:MAG: TlpA family protein disulfide reductase [Acidobacteriaceae bacterium]|nr:TlpA family protein disulfide reductase [Acidobacteriaceae bacterium]MBV9501441.1 TlpA family protein disulfide reductase [Acidobacteriaceae bacterium]